MLSLELIPLTPQAFVNRISINRPDEANIKEISYQLFEHLTINNRHFNTTSNLELSWCGVHSKKPAGPPLLVIDLEDGITMVVLVGFDYKLVAGRLILVARPFFWLASRVFWTEISRRSLLVTPAQYLVVSLSNYSEKAPSWDSLRSSHSSSRPVGQ